MEDEIADHRVKGFIRKIQMGGVPFLKRHPVLHPLNGGVLLALFLCVAPLLSPEIDSHREGLGESLGAAVCKCAGAAADIEKGSPSAPVQVI